jgi:hypothetical protein
MPSTTPIGVVGATDRIGVSRPAARSNGPFDKQKSLYRTDPQRLPGISY